MSKEPRDDQHSLMVTLTGVGWGIVNQRAIDFELGMLECLAPLTSSPGVNLLLARSLQL